MLNTIINSADLTLQSELICMAVSLLCGLMLSFTANKKNQTTSSYRMSLILLPAIVQIVILIVNGNLGVGVAVAGSFSLVRFRSLPGKATDIVYLFLAMAVGLCTGMGYVEFALLSTVFLCLCIFLLSKLIKSDSDYRCLMVTIPEDMDAVNVFDDIFQKYTRNVKQTGIRTQAMGTMYQITYDVRLKDAKQEKAFLDELRTRNGNLAVVSSHMAAAGETL